MKRFWHLCWTWLLLLLLPACADKIDPAWEELPVPVDEALHDILFIDEKEGFVAGGSRWERDRMLRTLDGGQSWEVFPEVYGKSLLGIAARDIHTWWTSGVDGKVLRYQEDEPVEVDQLFYWTPMHALAYSGDSLLVSVGGDGYSFGQIAKSLDNGNTWALVDTFSFELRDVDFSLNSRLVTCGYGAIMYSDDQGLNWQFSDAEGEFFSAIDFPSPKKGYAVGRTGHIYVTDDGGATWKQQRNGDSLLKNRHRYNDVMFIDPEIGYVAGDEGVLLRTTDGGDSWKEVSTQTEDDFLAVSVPVPGVGYVSTSTGRVFRFRE
ncbi:MAG: YCF48-related protein [Bacteroidota bacterium]